MIAKAIDKIVKMTEPHIVFVKDGQIAYSDKDLYEVKQCRRAEPLTVKNLGGFCEYIKQFAKNDTKEISDYFVLVESHRSVLFMSKLNEDREREILIKAVPEVPDFPFGRFINNEEMIILLQSAFVQDAETDLGVVQKFTGTVTAGTIKEYSDDGISQQVTVKQGPRGKVDDLVPSPCVLRPYRTFVEVMQPASSFIFRLEQGREQTVNAAIIEADGGAWKLDAVSNIIVYLAKELAGTGVKVIG